MANKYRNEIEIELGGKKYLLRATWETIVGIETNVGSIVGLLAQGGLTFKQCATIIIFGLRGAEDESLKFAELGEILLKEGIVKFGPQVVAFLNIALYGTTMEESSVGKPEPEVVNS